ncbi:hypothetical protein STEG23_028670 [Scotinomys teguina]
MCQRSWFLVILDVGGRLSRVLQRIPLYSTSLLPDPVTYSFVTYKLLNIDAYLQPYLPACDRSHLSVYRMNLLQIFMFSSFFAYVLTQSQKQTITTTDQQLPGDPILTVDMEGKASSGDPILTVDMEGKTSSGDPILIVDMEGKASSGVPETENIKPNVYTRRDGDIPIEIHFLIK